MSLTSSTSASEQWMKNLGVLKKPGPGETPNSQRWFNTMLTYLESKNLAWVVEPGKQEYADMKALEMTAAGDDKAKKATVLLRWMRAEAEVKALLLMSVDESHRLDIEGLPCKEAWKALQPANQANVLLRMVRGLLRERLTDHKSVAKYITKVRTAMAQLFSDNDARGLVTEAFVVLSTLAELQQQDRWSGRRTSS